VKKVYLSQNSSRLSVESALRELANKKPLALDLETTGLEPTKGEILLVGISDGSTSLVLHRSIYPFFKNWLREQTDGRRLIVGHNLSFDHKWLLHHWSIRIRRLFDTQWAHKALTCGRPEFDQASLAAVAWGWLGIELNKEPKDEFIGADPRGFETTAGAIEYLHADLSNPLALMEAMLPKIKEHQLNEALKLRFAMVPIIGELELYGAPVNKESYALDVEKAKELRAKVEPQVVDQLTPSVLLWRVEEFDKKFSVWQEWKQKYDMFKGYNESCVVLAKDCKGDCDSHVHTETPRERRDKINDWNRSWKERDENAQPPKPKPADSGPINLNSPQQVLAALSKLGYSFDSTRADEFEEYASQLEQSGSSDPLIQPFLTYKRLQKIVSAFGDPILEKIEDGVLRPSWNLMVTTGRMSCSGPNLQQVPKPVHVDGTTINLRRHFEAPEGFLIARMDFANIEMRIAADLSGDWRMIQDFINGDDIHGRTAATKLGISYEEGQRLKKVGDADFISARDAAKVDNFGTLYGAWNKQWIEVFSSTYPRLWSWLEEMGRVAVEQRVSAGADGFKKWWILPPQPDKRYEVQEWIEWKRLRNRIIRQGKNVPMQTTSAAITMAAAAAVSSRIEESDSRMWNIVHDELDLLMRDGFYTVTELDKLTKLSEKAGQKYLREVPCVVESSLAKYWSK
jgi:DNA polymerase I-like protein with 3'-5' exonuclease and polymerase domains